MVKKKRDITDYLFEAVFAFTNLFIVILFYKNILLTTVLLLIITIIGLIKWKSWRTFNIFLLGAIVGTCFEMFCIYIGVWEYALPNLYNIPFWLFILWGNTAAAIYQTALKIKEKKMKLK